MPGEVMTNSADITDASRRAGSVGQKSGRSKVRFQGIVESAKTAETAEFESFEAWAASTAGGDHQAARLGRELYFAARFLAVFVFFLVVVGWPIATIIGYWSEVGSLKGFRIDMAYTAWAVAFGVVTAPSLWLLGYLAHHIMHIIGRSEAVALSAQQLLRPDEAAIANVQTVGAVVRDQMEALNTGIDDALIRLASAEAMIRQHVGAIEEAGAAVEMRTSSAAEKVAAERARLIDLTETLNARADDFAVAIAEKAQANIEALQNSDGAASAAEERLDDRLARLEAAAQRALMSFEALSVALGDADEHMRTTSGSIEASANDVKRASEVAAKIADAAAESAARNAANIGMFSGQAAERARKAAEDAIEIARSEAERSSSAAVEFTTREAKRVTEAAAKAVEDVQAATRNAVESAAGNAERASSAAHLVTEAARLATTAAQDASQQVQKASAFAKKSADDAIGVSEAAAARVEARNKELAAARASLEAENSRLESLIDEQRRRADRLAEAIATQTERLSKLAENQLREQEAAARLAEAQAAIQKTKIADLDRAAKAEADRAARAQQAAEAEAAAKREAEEKDRATLKTKPAPRQADDARSNVLELGGGARNRAANRPSSAGVANRLDDLAAEISGAKDQRPPNERGASDERRKKDGVSWREILSATDEAEPLDLGAAGKKPDSARPNAERAAANAAMKIIAALQAFTLDLEMRLYGEPPVTLLERFERGDRNVFANRILRLNEADVKRRIRAESARDKAFEKNIHQFLQGFERLLEDATTSATADEELEEYLSSPLGRVYLLVGATVGYFA
jgi:hypothetical protein